MAAPTAPEVVTKMFQPPCAGGSFLARRETHRAPVHRLHVDVEPGLAHAWISTWVAGVMVSWSVAAQNGDRLALVAGLLEQLQRLLRVVVLEHGAAGIAGQRRAAHDQAVAHLVVLGIADDGAQEVLLVDQVVHRLPRLDVVERRVQVVEADEAEVGAEVAGLHQLDALGLLQDRQEVDVRVLVEVDLAVDERRHRGLRIGDPDELDAVDLGDLAAGE